MIESAILTADSIWTNHRYAVTKRCGNGVVVGRLLDYELAVHQSHLVQGSQTTRPIIGDWQGGQGRIFPTEPASMNPTEWLRRMRAVPRLEWDRRLARHTEDILRVKIALEGWSPDDLNTLCERGWFVGFSAHAPLWRIYGLISQEEYDGELPVFDGKMRSLDRFGAIYDSKKHPRTLKAS